MVKGTDRPAMTLAVDFGRKATKQTNKTPSEAENFLECPRAVDQYPYY